jgi:hypothetical protein
MAHRAALVRLSDKGGGNEPSENVDPAEIESGAILEGQGTMCAVCLAVNLHGFVDEAHNLKVSQEFLLIPDSGVDRFEFFPASRLGVKLD